MASTLMLGLGVKAARGTINLTRSYNRVYGRAGVLFGGYDSFKSEWKAIKKDPNPTFTPEAVAHIGRCMVLGWFVPVGVVAEYGFTLCPFEIRRGYCDDDGL